MVLDSSDSFILNLSYLKIPIKTLLNSGTTHCFINSSFVSNHRLPVHTLPTYVFSTGPILLILLLTKSPFPSYLMLIILFRLPS